MQFERYGKGIAKGLRVTITHLLRHPVTAQYPDQRLNTSRRIRGNELIWDNIKCTGCSTCAKSCPQGAIKIVTSVNLAENKYTVEEIDKYDNEKLATIKMNATPTSKTPDEKVKDSDGAIERFESFFDSQDNYTGQLVIDTQTGKIKSYSESLVSRYTAAEFSRKKGEPAQQKPDVLELVFTEVYSIELLE